MKPVRCPTCGRRGAWFDTPFGPFCSERCRLVDLGKWLGEEYRIPAPPDPAADHLEDEDRPPLRHDN